MRQDPDYENYLIRWSELYKRLNYDRGFSSYFLRKSHVYLEEKFPDTHKFPRVLEVGAGTGEHLRYVRHGYDEYVMTDSHPEMLSQIITDHQWRGEVIIDKQDATRLGYPNHQFDRLIAAHVLEHLERPHEVLREWCRVVRPGGTISILLPCDPGLAWRVGRAVSSRPKFKKAGLEYDYWMAREHINPINNLVALISYYFNTRSEGWYPIRIPTIDLNLFYICHVIV